MAKKAKQYPDISKLTGLKWQKQKPDNYREEICKCSFCGTGIYDNQNYYEGFHPVIQDDPTGGDPLFFACHGCATKAGLEW